MNLLPSSHRRCASVTSIGPMSPISPIPENPAQSTGQTKSNRAHARLGDGDGSPQDTGSRPRRVINGPHPDPQPATRPRQSASNQVKPLRGARRERPRDVRPSINSQPSTRCKTPMNSQKSRLIQPNPTSATILGWGQPVPTNAPAVFQPLFPCYFVVQNPSRSNRIKPIPMSLPHNHQPPKPRRITL